MKLNKLSLLALAIGLPGYVLASGSVFVTGHDSDWHAQGSVGAQHINQAAMSFVWSTGANSYYSAHGIHKFLFVGDDGYQGGDSRTGSPGVLDSGFTSSQFDIANFANISTLLPKLGTEYSAMWVASSSGELSQQLLDYLVANKSLIANFVNSGGGIYAGAEGQYGISSNSYAYIPGIDSSSALGQGEGGITVTPYGASLGLVNSDVNSNFSHNVFLKPDGLNVVDTDGVGNIISLAGRGTFGGGTINPTPSPGAAISMLIGTVGAAIRRRKK